MKEISSLSHPFVSGFSRGFFNRTNIRPPSHTYRGGRTPDDLARRTGWRWWALNSSGVSRQRWGIFGGVAGLCVRRLQFFRRDGAEHYRGDSLPCFRRFPATDGQRIRPADLAGWTR